MYLEIDEGFPSHRKTLRFCAVMKDPNAFAYVLRLWAWACRSAPDGSLEGMEPSDIEIAVQYRPLDGLCYKALVSAGFVDDVDGCPSGIHNWATRTGGAIAKMAAEAARKKATRDQAKADKLAKQAGPSRGHPVDGPAQNSGRPDTDKTRQDKSPDPDLSLPDLKASPSGSDPDQTPDPYPPGTVLVAKSPPEVSGFVLARMFGQIRSECVPGTLPWAVPRARIGEDKSQAVVDQANGDRAACEDLAPTMRLLFAEASAATDAASRKILEDPTYGFGAWVARFTGLREKLHGIGPPAPAKPKPKPAPIGMKVFG